MGGEPGWAGGAPPPPPAYPDVEAGTWESHVVAEVLVRTPGSATAPGAEKK
jgi:hypothetical protein